MKIDPKEFCHLSRSESFLKWLNENAQIIYADLSEFIKNSKSCKENRDKMESVLNHISVDRALAARLGRFIRKNYPAMIVNSAAHKQLQEQKTQNTSQEREMILRSHVDAMQENVFSGIDLTVMALPHRKIITLFEAMHSGKDLGSAAVTYCSQHATCEFVLTSSAAWIEYVPQELASIAGSIPDRNWMVRKWKRDLK